MTIFFLHLQAGSKYLWGGGAKGEKNKQKERRVSYVYTSDSSWVHAHSCIPFQEEMDQSMGRVSKCLFSRL